MQMSDTKTAKETPAKKPLKTLPEASEPSGGTSGRGKGLEGLLASPSRGSRPLRPLPEGVRGAAKQIRKFCLDCVGTAPLVKTCVGFNCPLWAWRFGKSPQFVKNADLLDPAKVRELAVGKREVRA